MSKTGTSSVTDKEGCDINVGDHVFTPFRGGTREGDVQAIYTDSTTKPADGDAGEVTVDVKNPPKVVFTNQRGKQVSHNPQALTHKED
ncbi:hypothetical protein BKA62DRAFT_435746 [Auriculariales sp. MPI-PUGE-AT-0066]|nr:hypothetical protein BKA62DRAFT_435746 [Auriculariales sp. MPI-PUGE-AT-0066]